MAIPLYDVSVTSFQQVLAALRGFSKKALAHCKANNIDLNGWWKRGSRRTCCRSAFR